jgi:hypothetical protein
MGKPVIDRLDWLEGFSHVWIAMHDYPDSRIGFDLIISNNGHPEMLAKATIHLDAYNYLPDEECFFIKNYSEHEGLGEALVKAGVVERTGRRVAYGPYDASADEYRFAPAYR